VQPSLPFDASPVPDPDGPGHTGAGRAQDPLEPTFVRHPRARRYVVRVLRDGSVRVTVPRWGSKREARAFAVEQRAWIERERARLARGRADGGAAPAEIAALRVRAAHELPKRLREIAAEHGLRAAARISVRDQRCRWGSCSHTGHICLNWRLVAMPAEVRDYVIIHELMHLKRMDHSRAFWALVAGACPGYKAARAWLRAHEDWLTSG
jgi:predicted metal-dependent hydrolase